MAASSLQVKYSYHSDQFWAEDEAQLGERLSMLLSRPGSARTV